AAGGLGRHADGGPGQRVVALLASWGGAGPPRPAGLVSVDCVRSAQDPGRRQADVVVHPTPHMRSATAGLSLNDSVYERLLRERIVFLGSEVDDDVANRITAQLLLLAAEDPEKDITFYINSPGGSVTAGMAIYDTMQLVEPEVSTWAVGFAASMGQFLLSSGTPGK